jgi:hypothetical protein
MPLWLFFPAPKGTNLALATMDVVYNGQPFIWVPAKTTIDETTMDYVYGGQPFVSYARG